jgi:hypothetical protein
MINEKQFLQLIHKLQENGYKSYHVNNNNKLIYYLYQKKYIDTYNYLILIYLRDINLKKLTDISQNIYYVKRIMDTKNKYSQKIKLLHKKTKEKRKLIELFKKIDFNDSTINDSNILIYHNYLIERLITLRNHFTLEELTYMKISLITISEAKNLTYNEMKNFYQDVFEQIDYVLRELDEFCLRYIDVNKTYMKICNDLNKTKNKKSIRNIKLKYYNIYPISSTIN